MGPHDEDDHEGPFYGLLAVGAVLTYVAILTLMIVTTHA